MAMPALLTRCAQRDERATPLEEVLAFLDKAQPACALYACSSSPHTLQLYAGLYALHAAGRIRLRQRFGRARLRRRLPHLASDDPVLATGANVLFVEVADAGLACRWA